ncbi:glycosyltransferase [Halalkalibacter alkalisediminis]|uniref:Glycosyltransferase n=1 Tax=Halalkalibacter alkalisediminis TaxID=935616 RepID=A0ABV6NKJ0_9BACI|nr:glycosyltransferase [Halalkalibacter alkalisediminis]
MKVLMICTEKLPVPAVRGGAIQTYIDGVTSLLSKDHDLTILGTTDPSLPEEEIVNNIHYVRKKGGLIETYREGIIEFLKDNSFDVIHVFNRPRLVLPVREHAPDARIILSMHNDMFNPDKIDHDEGDAAVDNLDKIITVSDYIGKTISDPFPNALPKLKTIYSGVDIDRFVPPNSEQAQNMRMTTRREHDLMDKKVILFAGRLSPNKGIDVLVKAMPELAKEHPEIALVIVGSKWFSVDEVTDYIGYVRAIANRMPIPVINTGFVKNIEIQKWFAAADVFVCPSQWQEPLARVHYEAMASGLPILTTARGGNPEVIVPNENGFVVESPEDPQSFVPLLSKLLSDPELCMRLGMNGRKMAEDRFIWSRVANDILSVWDEVENRIKNGISYTDIGAMNDNSESVDSPIEEIIEEINEQIQSNEETSLTAPTELLKEQEPIEEVIDVLNEQLNDSTTENVAETNQHHLVNEGTEEPETITEIIADIHEQMDDTVSPLPEVVTEEPETIEKVVEDINEQIVTLENESSLEIVEKVVEIKPQTKQERIKKLFLLELNKNNSLMDIIQSIIENKQRQHASETSIEIKDFVEQLEKLLKEQMAQPQKKKEFFEAVNDQTTAKLFTKLANNRGRKRYAK